MPLTSSTQTSGFETPVQYAERVLFSESLEEKLRVPGKMDHDAIVDSGAARDLHEIEPGRPENLHFAKTSDSRPAMPSRAALVNESSRGVLLHFFANHELLAAELMALAILRFRHAPPAFLRGLTNTLTEEQRHTTWYINRMSKCGIKFGEYPVNRFFWDAVSTMECPLDYVSRLSLTFEQANLDYSHYYAKVLDEAGDPASAAILQRIYRDEISHVGYGLRWFRRWKSESDTDWAALGKQLIFPLSPIRAKGNQTPFNEEGRRAAGFDEDFIRHLDLYERSRGRTPNVFFFNPEAENRAAVWPKVYHSPKKVQAVSNDLESLVIFLARRDDVVLMRNPPSSDHRRRLIDAGFQLPEIESLSEAGELARDSLLHERKIHRFKPWSKSPHLAETFRSLSLNETGGNGNWIWRPEERELFSKGEQGKAFAPWFGESFPIETRADLESAIESFRNTGVNAVVLKQCFATAGSGMRKLTLDELDSLLARGFSGTPRKDGGILLEPLHDRIFDFSIQFEIKQGRARPIATVEQIITSSGGFRGTLAMPKFCQGLDPELSRFLMTEALPLYEETSPFISALEKWARRFKFEGPLGLDSYLYRDEGGQLLHRPVCEINPRYTMGRVAHELRKHIAPGFCLKLEIAKAADLDRSALIPDFRQGRLSGGKFLLTEPSPHSHFTAIVSVAKQRSLL
ncbi:MAG: DUF455 family protein [Verrucomicrobiales bacterium]|nr:DUF455 family protein [Verrucomicrobiales bacterium]